MRQAAEWFPALHCQWELLRVPGAGRMYPELSVSWQIRPAPPAGCYESRSYLHVSSEGAEERPGCLCQGKITSPSVQADGSPRATCGRINTRNGKTGGEGAGEKGRRAAEPHQGWAAKVEARGAGEMGLGLDSASSTHRMTAWWGWKGSPGPFGLPSAPAKPPQAGCPAPHLAAFGRSPRRTPQPL